MQTTELSVSHAFAFTPAIHRDERGAFLESYRADALEEATGRRFDLRQSNVSISARGVARGIHFADVPTGQAKYVTVIAGTVIDYVIDLRVGSATFGKYDTVTLDDIARRAVFIPEGFGHMFVVTSDSATVHYLTTDIYRPERERTVNPRDTNLAIEFPLPTAELRMSDRDLAAPSLAEALGAGQLPTMSACLAQYAVNAIGAEGGAVSANGLNGLNGEDG